MEFSFAYGIFMEMMHTEIKTGYLYHIKDEYFGVVTDENLIQNHEKGKKTYFTIKDKKIFWFILLNSKVDKYMKIVENKKEKYGFCNTTLMEDIFDETAVILLIKMHFLH